MSNVSPLKVQPKFGIAAADHDGVRRLTGLGVLAWMACFFAVVFIVDGIMMRFAYSTFGGVDADNAYKTGLAVEEEVKEADAQDARGWTASIVIGDLADGSRQLTIEPIDRAGQPVASLAGKAELLHATDRRQDRDIAVTEIAPGKYRGVLGKVEGKWDIVVDLFEGDKRMFRTRNHLPIRGG